MEVYGKERAMKAAGDMERRRQTEELRRYDIEGAVLETELCLDELTGLYIEILPGLIEKPVYTAKGNPVMFTGEDACSYGQPREGESCIDCGSCIHYNQMPDTLLGVCRHEKKRKASG